MEIKQTLLSQRKLYIKLSQRHDKLFIAVSLSSVAYL